MAASLGNSCPRWQQLGCTSRWRWTRRIRRFTSPAASMPEVAHCMAPRCHPQPHPPPLLNGTPVPEMCDTILHTFCATLLTPQTHHTLGRYSTLPRTNGRVSRSCLRAGTPYTGTSGPTPVRLNTVPSSCLGTLSSPRKKTSKQGLTAQRPGGAPRVASENRYGKACATLPLCTARSRLRETWPPMQLALARRASAWACQGSAWRCAARTLHCAKLRQ